jgi:hypothetical protein
MTNATTGVYTLRPTTREERGCVCPFPPGCYGPCRSAGTYWEVRALVRERHAWATVPASSLVSDDQRAAELARIDAALSVARAAIRERRMLRTLVWLRLWLHRFDVVTIHSSAGKDSQTALRWALAVCWLAGVLDRVAVLHLVLDRDPRNGHEPRVEWQQVPELAAEQARRHGVTLAAEGGWTVQNAVAAGRALTRADWAGQMHYARRDFDGDLWDDVATRRKRDGSLRGWPTMFTRFCTSDWKTAVGRAFTQALCDSLALGRPARVLQVLGFRAQESEDRAARPVFGLNAGVTAPTIRRVWEWLPIHALTLPDVWADIRDSGVPYHPAYDEGLARLSCRFCVLSSRRDQAIARRMSPSSAAAVIGVEERIGDPFQARIKKTVRDGKVVSTVKIPLPLSAVEPAPGRPGFDVRWASCPDCGVPVLAEARETSRACPAHASAGAWDLLDVPDVSGCVQLDLFVSGWAAALEGAR